MPSYVQDPFHAATNNSITLWEGPANEAPLCESKHTKESKDIRIGTKWALCPEGLKKETVECRLRNALIHTAAPDLEDDEHPKILDM